LEQTYAELPSEADPDTAPGVITEDWPQNGEVEFQHYTMAYRVDLPAVLNDLSFKVGCPPKLFYLCLSIGLKWLISDYSTST